MPSEPLILSTPTSGTSGETDVVLVVVGDGREEYLAEAIASVRSELQGDIVKKAIIDDSGDREYGHHLVQRYPDFDVISHGQRMGMAMAIRSAWAYALTSGAPFVFHLEEDFVFNRTIRLEALINILNDHPQLSQIVLQRQPWSSEEQGVGNVIAYAAPDAQRHDTRGFRWCEHDSIFSVNPTLIPRRVVEMGWPTDNEAGMTEALRAAGMTMGWLGDVGDPPAVTHIGHRRGEGWKL